MSSNDIEYRYPLGGGFDGLLRFDGRVIEFFNLGAGGSVRAPYPESTFERSEPNKKGRVDYKLMTAAGNILLELPIEADHVAGFDEFVGKVHKAE